MFQLIKQGELIMPRQKSTEAPWIFQGSIDQAMDMLTSGIRDDGASLTSANAGYLLKIFAGDDGILTREIAILQDEVASCENRSAAKASAKRSLAIAKGERDAFRSLVATYRAKVGEARAANAGDRAVNRTESAKIRFSRAVLHLIDLDPDFLKSFGLDPGEALSLAQSFIPSDDAE